MIRIGAIRMPRRGKHRQADRRDEAGLEQARDAAQQARRDLVDAQEQHTEAQSIAATLRAIRQQPDRFAQLITDALDPGGEES